MKKTIKNLILLTMMIGVNCCVNSDQNVLGTTEQCIVKEQVSSIAGEIQEEIQEKVSEEAMKIVLPGLSEKELDSLSVYALIQHWECSLGSYKRKVKRITKRRIKDLSSFNEVNILSKTYYEFPSYNYNLIKLQATEILGKLDESSFKHSELYTLLENETSLGHTMGEPITPFLKKLVRKKNSTNIEKDDWIFKFRTNDELSGKVIKAISKKIIKLNKEFEKISCPEE